MVYLSTRTEFWRDTKNLAACRELGWKTLVVWECAIKGKTRLPAEELTAVMQNLLLYKNQNAELPTCFSSAVFISRSVCNRLQALF